MSILFKVQDRIVIPNAETLLLEPFKTIWERDETVDKEVAMAEFKYIEFTTSMLKTNPFSGYGEQEKEKKVREDCIFMEDWNPDEFVIKGQDEIVRFSTEASTTYTYYMSNKKAAEEMTDFFNNFDINQINMKTGNPMYKPKDITNALKDSTDVMQRLDTLKDKVEQELFQVVKRRGEKVISPFADPESI